MQDRIALITVVAGGRGDTPLEKAVATKLIGEMNLLRLKATARILARGLAPDIYWWDLLQEAFARVLNGTRHRPPDVPIDVFMTGVMRSLRAEYRRRQWQFHCALARRGTPASDVAPDPERSVLAQEELEAIGELFADDPIVTHIITGLGDGLSPEEIRSKYGLTNTEYDSARKRMRRALLREGIRSKFHEKNTP
jgi:DNA-directed RNA polymerase specialized sigma24 family protein